MGLGDQAGYSDNCGDAVDEVAAGFKAQVRRAGPTRVTPKPTRAAVPPDRH